MMDKILEDIKSEKLTKNGKKVIGYAEKHTPDGKRSAEYRLEDETIVKEKGK